MNRSVSAPQLREPREHVLPPDYPYQWRGGSLILDVAGPIGWGYEEPAGWHDVPRPEYEHLGRYAHLVAWSAAAGFLPEDRGPGPPAAELLTVGELKQVHERGGAGCGNG